MNNKPLLNRKLPQTSTKEHNVVVSDNKELLCWVAVNDPYLPENPKDMSLFKTLDEACKWMPGQRYFKVKVKIVGR